MDKKLLFLAILAACVLCGCQKMVFVRDASGVKKIFQMEGEIRFVDAQKSVIIRFSPELKDQLPELK